MRNYDNMIMFHCILFAVYLLLGTLHHCQGANVTNVRLADTNPNRRFGRLEIQVNGDNTWGVVCDDGWAGNSANAIVACRELGFTNGGTAILDDTYGRGTGAFLLDDTDCAADMTSLAQCSSAQQHDCGPGDSTVGLECNANSGVGVTTFRPPDTSSVDTGVVDDNCNNPANVPTVRLFGKVGVNGMGYVEVQNPTTSQWGFVCDDGWNSLSAMVVCAQLCFPTNYTAKPGIPAEHRVLPTSPVIILDDVNCQGTEATLQDCDHNNFATTNDCSSENAELAGVQCVAADFSPPEPPNPVLECGGGLIKASFHRSRDADLEEKHLTILADPTCTDVTKSTTADFVTLTVPVDKCGTQVSRNGTHIIYENTIKYASTSEEGPITRVNTYKVDVLCALPVGKTVTQRIQPVTEAVTKDANGVITAVMAIYRSDSFANAVTDNPVRIPLGENLHMAIVMEDYDPRLLLVATDCVSTPTGDTSNARLTHTLFKDKCIVEPTVTFYTLSNNEFAFRFTPFKFNNYPLLYIQCNAIICLTSDRTAECDRSCNNTKPATSGRKRRSALYTQSVESQAIQFYDPLEPTDKNKGTEVVIDVAKEIKELTDKTKTLRPTSNDITTVLPTEQQETPPPPLNPMEPSSPPPNSKISNTNEGEQSNQLSQQGGDTASVLSPSTKFLLLMLLCIFMFL